MSQLFGNFQEPSVAEIELLNRNYEEVLGKLEHPNQPAKSFAAHPTNGTPGGVEIGDLKFPGRPDL